MEPGQNCTPRVSAPSTSRLAPVMKLAAGLHKNTAARNLLWFRHPAGGIQRHSLGEQLWIMLLDALPDTAREVGVARGEAVGPDALRRELVSQPLRVMDDRGLEYAIWSSREIDLPAGYAADRH